MEAGTLDIRKPVDEVLIDLRKYYTEQLAYIDTLLRMNPKNVSISKNVSGYKNVFKEEDQTLYEDYVNFTKIWFWEKNALKFIDKYFPSEKFTTRDLAIKCVGTEDFDKDFLAKIIYAASLSLGKLKKKGQIKAEKEDGVKGFKYSKI